MRGGEGKRRLKLIHDQGALKVGQTKAALLGQSVLEVQLIKRMTVFMVRPPNLQCRLVRTYTPCEVHKGQVDGKNASFVYMG